jgi:hypothetical protein
MLARGQPHGMYFFEGTGLEAARSFWAMALCLPMFFVLGRIAGAGESLNDWTIEALGFVIAWLGFALAAEAMAGMAGRSAEWPRFIAAWNWTTLFQYVALVVGSVFGLAIGGGVAQIASIAVLSYALWLEWFATKHALNIPGPAAVMFVLLDLAIGLFVQAVVLRVIA